jgi:putative ABC transport system permease protein
MVSALLARLRSYWRGLRHRRQLSAEMADEFRFHVEHRAADLVRSGMTPSAASRRARLEFGSAARYMEEGRESRGLRLVDELGSDMRCALRSLARRPLFTATAVLTLAVGVGANAAVFSLVSATLLRPLPFADPDRLVILHQTRAEPGRGPVPLRWSYPEYAALRGAVTTVPEIASYATAEVNMVTGAAALRAQAELVTASYFTVLRVTPVLGRVFLAAEDLAPGAHPVAILSHRVWQHHFGSSESVLGRSVAVNGVPLTVVGVAPPGFHGLSGGRDIWIPQAMGPLVSYEAQLTSAQHFHTVIGRLRAGVTHVQARAEVATVGAAAAASAREQTGAAADGTWTVELMRLDDVRREPATVRARLVLSGAVALVLLIAAVNLAALLLARAVDRSRELALRAALGAGRRRLVRHILVEGGVVGAGGAVLGALIAVASVRAFAGVAAERLGAPMPWFANVAALDTPTPDWRVIVFAAVIAIGSGLLAALVPALRATRGDLTPSLRFGARGGTVGLGTVRRPTLLSAAVVAQVAGALVLLAGATLLLKAFHQLRAIEPGFDAEGLVTLSLASGGREHESAAAAHAAAVPVLEQVLERVQGVPGVTSATVSFCTPYMRCSTTPVYIEGRDPDSDDAADAASMTSNSAAARGAPIVGRHYVGPDHFRTFGIPLLRGRALTADDRAGRPRVAVINETAARSLWPGADPIGRRVRFGSGGGFASPDSLTEIVGIVGDVVYGHPGESVRPDFYTSYLQFTWPRAIVTVRTATEPGALVPALRRAIAEVDGGLPIYDVRSMRERSAQALADERFATAVVATFAAIGLLLAMLGVHGVMAYTVVQRRRELGIRLALGATSSAVLALVVRQAAAVAGLGLLVGGLAALSLTRLLRALVSSVGPSDPVVVGVMAGLLLGLCIAASIVPARTAARIDPMRTLGD